MWDTAQVLHVPVSQSQDPTALLLWEHQDPWCPCASPQPLLSVCKHRKSPMLGLIQGNTEPAQCTCFSRVWLHLVSAFEGASVSNLAFCPPEI